MRTRHGLHSEMRSKTWHNAAGLAERGVKGGVVFSREQKGVSVCKFVQVCVENVFLHF